MQRFETVPHQSSAKYYGWRMVKCKYQFIFNVNLYLTILHSELICWRNDRALISRYSVLVLNFLVVNRLCYLQNKYTLFALPTQWTLRDICPILSQVNHPSDMQLAVSVDKLADQHTLARFHHPDNMCS